ncbi:hypothetical protein J7E73_32250 [Paenibacillus albidus]|uniref:hypothetical protein n=1 Tax=Paenibacillus albidus TaxID=2041023 RepID=UPI001BE5AA08|nr:hypothetical protein [Paenibacillus albidus]MBT2293684.1 hypothetical protein [Paenibacillus albidus]
MKNKLRTITVDEVIYAYKLEMRIADRMCINELRVFRKELKVHPLNISILTWDDPIMGSPLNTGIVLGHAGCPKGEVYNLNYPKRIREWILYGQSLGWDGSQTVEVEDGLAAMRTIGYFTAALEPKGLD